MTAHADILRRARAKVEKGWCRGELFSGEKVCAYGAFYLVFANDNHWNAGGDALDAFHEVIGGQNIMNWNDEPGRTQAEVLAAFDAAIELAT